MNPYLTLGKYSFGMGDRFAHQGRAQLQACALATQLGADVVPVWNKSNREHLFIGTEPSRLRAEADAAVKALGWNKPYHVDADHEAVIAKNVTTNLFERHLKPLLLGS